MTIQSFLKIKLLLLCYLTILTFTHSVSAGTGSIDKEHFESCETIIYAETFECHNEIYCKTVKKEEWALGLPSEGAVKINRKIAKEYWDLHFDFNRHEKQLYSHSKKPPTEKQLEEARKKDIARVAQIKQSLQAELTRIGLDFTPSKDEVIFFDKGSAKMKVIESLKGELKEGDEIEVYWNCLQWRVSCPPLIPRKGNLGWTFKAVVKKDTKVLLGHGFFSLEEAKKVKTEFLK